MIKPNNVKIYLNKSDYLDFKGRFAKPPITTLASYKVRRLILLSLFLLTFYLNHLSLVYIPYVYKRL